MSREELSKYIDQTRLNPLTTEKEVIAFCEEAMTFDFRSVCIPPAFVDVAYKTLSSSNLDVCTVIGFPLGYNSTSIKLFEAKSAIDLGAHELDVVINQGLLKSNDHSQLLDEMYQLTKFVQSNYCKIKWIVETAYLNKDELVTICKYCIDVKADFIKTSTGFANKGAQIDHIALWKSNIKNGNLKIKASGGIKTLSDALQFIEAGADRLGCSSGVDIINELK